MQLHNCLLNTKEINGIDKVLLNKTQFVPNTNRIPGGGAILLDHRVGTFMGRRRRRRRPSTNYGTTSSSSDNSSH